jgi:hypothetical protein
MSFPVLEEYKTHFPAHAHIIDQFTVFYAKK